MKTSYFLMPAYFISFFFSSFTVKDDVPRQYEKERQIINLERQKLKLLYDSAGTEAERDEIIEKASAFLEKKILEGLFFSWYGTQWDFNGYTDIPGEGKIACGYFVSTVLKHAGFNLNRYKLAQKAASEEISILSSGEKIHKFLGINRDQFYKKPKMS